MGFSEAITLFFKNYTNFNGRSRRAEFWWVQLVILVPAFIVGFFSGVMGEGGNLSPIAIGLMVIFGLFFLAILIPLIALSVRRFHDLNQTGWLVLVFAVLGIIPVVGFLASIGQWIWFAFPGTVGTNKYGPDPKSGSHDVDVFN